MHGGKISAKTRPMVAARVFLHLPAARAIKKRGRMMEAHRFILVEVCLLDDEPPGPPLDAVLCAPRRIRGARLQQAEEFLESTTPSIA